MMTIQELLGEVDRLPATEKWQLVKYMLDTLEQEQVSQPQIIEYHQFLGETYGSLRNMPIERWEQGKYEVREPLQ